MKKNIYIFLTVFITTFVLFGFTGDPQDKPKNNQDVPSSNNNSFVIDHFADLRISKYLVPDFELLTIKQKELVYYLNQAALVGRDITWDQNYKHNLCIRKTLEAIYEGYKGDRSTDNFNNFLIYLKRVWYSNGIHHHANSYKIIPDFPKEYFAEMIKNSEGVTFPLQQNETIDDLIAKLTPIIFDPNIARIKVCSDPQLDMISNSAVNFYENLTQKEVEDYYKATINPDETYPMSYGLNSKLIKVNGRVIERVYKLGDMYSSAIEKIIFWLEKAAAVAENADQKATLDVLIQYYKTGDLKVFDAYNVMWVKDTLSEVDAINGFIEVYNDPMSMKATFEAVVSFRDISASRRAETFSRNAQWFEDHSPINPAYKKKNVKGVSAKVITVTALGGDCYPNTPIGINLPNSLWIRKLKGSKSVTMGNILYAYNQSQATDGMIEEFCYTPEEIDLAKKYDAMNMNINTDMHECLGHASGQAKPGVTPDMLKNYYSPLEEARSDLYAIYYYMDPKLIDLGILPSEEAAKAAYNFTIRRGMMTQLTRIELGKNIQNAHYRNRQLIAKWTYEKGLKDNVISKVVKDGKTYFVVNDYKKLRNLFGQLLAEIQRIISEGDYEAGKNLIETYAVKVDQDIHKEVISRWKKLNAAPYGGFVNPYFTPIYDAKGKMIDVKVEYPEDYIKQMLFYSKNYSFLPTYN
ncbi:MAG: dihydrofolate reductase [Bacteroidales bacterium]|nr:dihydrofolate reductase [Bacteroidales bacterium]